MDFNCQLLDIVQIIIAELKLYGIVRYIFSDPKIQKKVCHIGKCAYLCTRFERTNHPSSIAQLVRAPDC